MTLLVLADGADADGRPAALLPAGRRSLIRGVLDGAATLGLDCAAVLTRTAWVDEVSGELRDAGATMPVLPYDGLPGALVTLADLLQRATGPVLVAHGDLSAHTGALAAVVDEPRPGSAVLSGPGEPAPDGADVGGGQRGLGLLRVGEDDRAQVAAVARRLGGLAVVDSWDGDPIETLLGGLARHGVAVATVPVNGYVCRRPRSRDAAERAARAVAATDEHRLRLANAARPGDGFYSTFVVRRVSRRLTALAVRRGWTPNAITVASLGVGLLAAACFLTGARWGLVAGAVLLQASLVVDCSDGEVARYTRRFSPLGAWLDATFDRVKEYTVYAALAVGAARSGDGVWLLAAATLGLQVFRHVVDFGFAVRQEQARADARVGAGAGTRVDSRAGAPAAAPIAAAPAGSPPAGSAPAGSPPAGSAPAGSALGRGAAELSERTNRSPALVWAKRVVIMPIGERWLVISVAAAASGARAVFWSLLVLGAVAAAYTTTGRVLRSAADRARVGEPGGLGDFLDAGLLGRRFAASLLAGRFGWMAPAAARALEYATVTALAAGADPDVLPAAFAYLCALAYHHYDTVYRVRHTGAGPARWVTVVGLGVDGRLVLVVAAAVFGVLGPVLWVLAAAFAAAYLAESVSGWRAWLAGQAGR